MTDGRKMRTIRAQAERNSKNGRNFFIFAVIVIFFAFMIFVFCNFFNVKKISVEGLENTAWSEEEIVACTGVKKGDNLFRVNSGEVLEKLYREYPYIKEAEVTKKFPSTLKVSLTFDTPALFAGLGEDVFLLSSDGKVLDALGEGEEIPDGVCEIKLPSVAECFVGETIVFREKEQFDTLIEVYNAFLDSGIAGRLTFLDVTNKFDVDAVVENRFEIIFGTWEAADAKAKLLSEVLSNDIWTDSSGIIDVSDSREAVVRLTGSAAN